ncbi:MAG: hypothetical protein ACAI38_06500 [Myxococcota bacterium]
MARCAVRIALVTTLLLGCGSAEDARPYVILRVEDPSNIAATGAGGAPVLELRDASGNASRFDDLPGGFPLTVTLTSELRGPQRVTVELYRATDLVGRGSVTIDVLAQNQQEATVTLDLICVADGNCPPLGVPPEEDELPPPPAPHEPASDPDPECGEDCPPVATPCTSGKSGAIELEPDGTACGRDGNSDGVCYAGACVDAGGTPACDQYLSLDFFGEGQILGGVDHGVTVNQLKFPQIDGDGYNPQWVVEDDDIRPGDPATPSATAYTLYAVAPYQLASFRIRTQAGTRCQFTTEPAANANVVRNTSFATVTLTRNPASSGDQKVRFDFTCEPGGLAGLRIDDFCLVDAP